MQGKVKWFSHAKGFGYIVADDGEEHSFNARDINGADLPRNGDIVNFESYQGKKGPRASAVEIVDSSHRTVGNRASGDERIVCLRCRKKMMPRMSFYNGSPRASYCPFCGYLYRDFVGWCFIATAVYGDYNAPEVVVLRRFRDETLSRFGVGRSFIASYYRHSPPIANFLKRNRFLADALKPVLSAFARYYNHRK